MDRENAEQTLAKNDENIYRNCVIENQKEKYDTEYLSNTQPVAKTQEKGFH